MAEVSSVGRSCRGLNILLIAYEFPPSPSPQSLRWAYLSRELAMLGHSVHVLAPEHPGTGGGLPVLPAAVVVHRTFAGPSMGLLNLLARRRRTHQSRARVEAVDGGAGSDGSSANCPAPEPLNWKGRLHNAVNNGVTRAFHAAQRMGAGWFFPDGRAEWYPWARRALDRLLDQLEIDVVISSHEPATTLSLGLRAQRRGYPWIADLGDPVQAPYTPSRWTRRALRLEREVCQSADLVSVTTEALAERLSSRYAVRRGGLVVLTQGFDGMASSGTDLPSPLAGPALELLYTGSFYSFRRIGALLDAVQGTPGVRLNIASITVPDDVLAASRRSPGAVRLLGFLPHAEALTWQRRCHVLVNLANDDPGQVPGKFYEYLGSGRPILHVGNGDDAAAALLARISRGWVCHAEPGELALTLQRLQAWAVDGKLSSSLDLSYRAVREYDWTAICGQLNEKMTTLLAERGQ